MSESEKRTSAITAIGAAMFWGAVLVIACCVWNYFRNEAQLREHPMTTLFSGGENLSSYGYSFWPPTTGFEIAVLAIGVVGIVLSIVSDSK